MPPRPRKRRILAGWWLLSLMLASFASAPAHAWRAVLCLGDDGHVAVERAAGPDCVDFLDHEPHGKSDGERLAAPDPARHCGDCLDLEMTSADSLAPAKPLAAHEIRAGDAAVLPRVAMLPAAPSPATRVKSHPRAPVLPDPVLHERRTIVLVV